MSKLDDLLFDPAETICEEWCIDEHPKDVPAMVEQHQGGTKKQIKELFIELIDRDIPHSAYCDLMQSRQYLNQEDLTCSCEAEAVNEHKGELRRKVEEL